MSISALNAANFITKLPKPNPPDKLSSTNML